jgi:hypothetical protein
MSFLLEKIKLKTIIFVDEQKLLKLQLGVLGRDMFKILDYGIGFLRFWQQLVKKFLMGESDFLFVTFSCFTMYITTVLFEKNFNWLKIH